MTAGAPRSGLYAGRLVHVRRDAWATRRFAYPLYTACFDLDELPTLARRLRLLSHGGRNLFAIRDVDYHVSTYAPHAGLAAAARALLAERGLPTPARVELITQPRVAGYVFNPVSFFVGYDADGAPQTLIAEVNNTYGGHHLYVLGPDDRVAGRPGEARWRAPRAFFVSPFLHGDVAYEFVLRGARPGAPALDAAIDVTDPAGDLVFHARLTGDRAPLDDRALARAAIRYPLMTVSIIGLIHWQALKLHWHRVPYRRPDDTHAPRPA